ncbi:EamA family transporter [Dendrosporobacter sp. 1207_IL3150]|uniref:EamA family transporter n=1 Tax=Dendrosporobacter sp. 1207_IL3150 TaxID=3084054 RepID=UPI002FD8F426
MAIMFAVFGMLCWGVAPIFGKFGLQGVHPITALSLRTLLAATMVLGWVVCSRGYTDFLNVPFSFWIYIIIEAILATLVGDLAYFYALKYGNVNQVSLVMACAPIVTMLASFFILGENVSYKQILGASLITAGLALVCSE